VTFYSLDLLELFAPNRLCLRLICSAGAYVRSLAHDLGQALGTFAHLAVLRREAAGPFTLAQAHPLSEIEKAAQQKHLPTLLLPPAFGLELPRLAVPPAEARRLGFGQKVVFEMPAEQVVTFGDTELAQAYDPQGAFLGIVRHLGSEGGRAMWKAEKWFGNDER
jgi:tRNA pseudouridine55 synthase